MLSLFALRVARLFFKPLPLRNIGGDGHNMRRESRGNHRRLSLLTISFHFRVTLTGITSGTVQHNIVRVQPNPQPTSCTLFPNFMVGKKVEFNTEFSLLSTP